MNILIKLAHTDVTILPGVGELMLVSHPSAAVSDSFFDKKW